ncbi:ABC transporter ATP-binding protein [Streptomyces sp. SID3343]|uniref:ABC transporter ATP-binding protein n=1 Tax=Streptomyces sp. SID3343 TaxID=2690260 RepID=UPI00136C3374|nr:ABC transporter ATP-binding protein [Streptomyces sp. SID3343]MYW05326.1 ATP-binding cassette domain-containing protein [Streptomyces sp. SID3343]
MHSTEHAARDRTRETRGVGVEIRGVSHWYGRHRALIDVDLDILAGRITCLLGPNGAGKSTLVHGIVDMVRPSEGSIRVGGLAPAEAAAAALIGFVYDDLPLPHALTGREALRLLAATHARWDQPLVDELVDLLGLDAAIDRPIGAYSHGMKRKLQIVASLGQRPALWVLDEPLRGLDPVAATVLTALLHRFVETDGTVLVATHDLLAAEVIGDDIAIVCAGRLVRFGALDTLRAEQPGGLTELYLSAAGLTDEVAVARTRIGALGL